MVTLQVNGGTCAYFDALGPGFLLTTTMSRSFSRAFRQPQFIRQPAYADYQNDEYGNEDDISAYIRRDSSARR